MLKHVNYTVGLPKSLRPLTLFYMIWIGCMLFLYLKHIKNTVSKLIQLIILA